ncbi:BolA family protein [Castellaniella sp.]|uniref:BolA family protein n=1 Tax=Castellaniella sp. TaxID=1955812 RepID=UPI00355CD46D
MTRPDAPQDVHPEDLYAELLRRFQALEPIECTLTDESHRHRGHPGARGGARHFHVRIVSNQFEGIGALARHRMVLGCVQNLMPHPVHALAIQAFTPTEGNT